MKTNPRLLLIAAAAAFGLAACTEKPQELHSGVVGKPAYDGTGSNFVAPGWKQGDKNSWQQELKVRAQRGQNEYTRVN